MIASRLLRTATQRCLIPQQSINLVKFDLCKVAQQQSRLSSNYMITMDSDHGDVTKIPVQYGFHREVLVEQLDYDNEQDKSDTDLLSLHPDVWAVYPRVDIIHQNVVWQQKYNTVNYIHTKSVKEMIYTYGGGAKPWPQKGTGRARQGSRRAPQWVNGGKVHGPRGPKPLYYMLPYHIRVYGLTHTLSVKFVQDDVVVVDSLHLSSSDPEHLLKLARDRGWSEGVLFVDTEDQFPENITAACEHIPYMNLMPVYGLNVISMMKHQTLVLTSRAVQRLTEKLLFALNRNDMRTAAYNLRNDPSEAEIKLEKHRPVV